MNRRIEYYQARPQPYPKTTVYADGHRYRIESRGPGSYVVYRDIDPQGHTVFLTGGWGPECDCHNNTDDAQYIHLTGDYYRPGPQCHLVQAVYAALEFFRNFNHARRHKLGM